MILVHVCACIRPSCWTATVTTPWWRRCLMFTWLSLKSANQKLPSDMSSPRSELLLTRYFSTLIHMHTERNKVLLQSWNWYDWDSESWRSLLLSETSQHHFGSTTKSKELIYGVTYWASLSLLPSLLFITSKKMCRDTLHSVIHHWEVKTDA